jgi:hypothetical protein
MFMEELTEEKVQSIRNIMQEYIVKTRYIDYLRTDLKESDISIDKVLEILYWNLYKQLRGAVWPYDFTITEERILTVTINYKGKKITITVPSINTTNVGTTDTTANSKSNK